MVIRSGRTATLFTAAGIIVTFDWRSLVSVTLPSTYMDAVGGLCGNYNGNRQDDKTMSNGQLTNDANELGKSWQVGVVPGCSPDCQGPLCEGCSDSEEETYADSTYCGIIADASGPFADCHSEVDPAPYLANCVFDTCLHDGDPDVFCGGIAAYVSACQDQGITIQSWRTPAFCRKTVFSLNVSRYEPP